MLLQNLDPWMSEDDLDKGTRWGPEISKQLQDAQIGILCLTTENIAEPWINFEAGAISKQVGEARACTYLLGLNPNDITGPLAQFQASKADKSDTKKLVQTLNLLLGEGKVHDTALNTLFEKLWSDLETELNQILKKGGSPDRPKRTQQDLLEEILSLVREQSKIVLATLPALLKQQESTAEVPPIKMSFEDSIRSFVNKMKVAEALIQQVAVSRTSTLPPPIEPPPNISSEGPDKSK